jgi:hypothetical protein
LDCSVASHQASPLDINLRGKLTVFVMRSTTTASGSGDRCRLAVDGATAGSRLTAEAITAAAAVVRLAATGAV